MNEGICSTINLSERNVTKLAFVYDNGRPYNAAGIKKVKFNDTDLDDNECISYSQKDGTVSVVYRKDLAAVTVHYEDDAMATQKLLPCAIIDGGAHIKIRQPKGTSPLSTEDKAKQRAKRIKSSIARYTKRMKKGLPITSVPKAKAKKA